MPAEEERLSTGAEDGVEPPDAPGSTRALCLISLGVLLGSSPWLAGSAAAPSLQASWRLSAGEAAWLTSSVQLGFISGTFLYAITNLADRFPARRVFFLSAALGALFHAGFAWLSQGLPSASAFRFLTGVTLAGVYPVGMKIIATWFRSGLGWRLGVLVGALVLGSACPYLLRGAGAEAPWRAWVGSASFLALAGGLLVLFGLEEGPFLRERAPFRPRVMFQVFREPRFFWNASGYFGHMWELYAFWSVLSLYVPASPALRQCTPATASLLVFLVVAMGAAGCVLGGLWSRRWGEAKVASFSLAMSATACLLSGFCFALPAVLWVPFLLAWGFFVVADSPQFSALAARSCPPRYTGTALTVQNGVGFAISVLSIQLVPWLAGHWDWRFALVALAPGPLFGCYAMRRFSRAAERAPG